MRVGLLASLLTYICRRDSRRLGVLLRTVIICERISSDPLCSLRRVLRRPTRSRLAGWRCLSVRSSDSFGKGRGILVERAGGYYRLRDMRQPTDPQRIGRKTLPDFVSSVLRRSAEG